MLVRDRIISAIIIIVINHLLPISFFSGGSYVSSIANGLMTALSLLVSISVFISMLTYQRLQRNEDRDSLISWIKNCLWVNIIIIMVLTVIGYRLIAAGEFSYAYYVFTDSFIIAITANFLLLTHADDMLSIVSWEEKKVSKK